MFETIFKLLSNFLAAAETSSASEVNIDLGGAMVVFALLFFIWLFFWLFFIVAAYIYSSLCLMMIAKKTKTENDWWAWIPILNMVLLLNIAKRPLWWIVFFFIPFANIVVTILVWMDIAKARGKPEWVGILILVPIGNFVVPAYLAFSQ